MCNILPILIFIRMKQINKNFSKSFPLWLACGFKDTFRTSMHYIKFANGYAYATDAHILVRARLTDISDFDEPDLALLEGKYIHGNNFKKIVKSKGVINITEDFIEVTETDYSVRYPLLKGIRFPECEKVLNGESEVRFQKEFGISADYLNTLSEVMDCYNGVQMEWRSNQMFLVKPIGGHKDIKGVIMTKLC